MARSEPNWAEIFGNPASGTGTSTRRKGEPDWAAIFGGTPAETAAEPEKKKDDGGLFGAVKRVAGGAASGALSVMDGLDVGRRAVFAGATEIGDGLEELFDRENADTYGGKIQDTGFNFDDFVQNTRNGRAGFGDVVEVAAPDANPWVKRAAGFVGDVATDPLTYVTFGTATAGRTAVEGAGAASRVLGRKEIGSRLLRMTDDQVRAATGVTDVEAGRRIVRNFADDVLEDGTGRLTKEASAALGVKTGASVPIPFTGGRRAVLPGTAPLANYVAKAGGATRRATWGKFTDRITPQTWEKFETIPGLRQIRRNHGNATALQFSQAHYGAGNAAEAWGGATLSEFDQVYRRHDGVDWNEVTTSIEEGATDLLEPAAKQAADDLSGLLEKIRTEINSIDPDFQVPKLPDYYPHVITDELREILADSTGRAGRGVQKASHSGKRNLRKGEEFLGEVIETDDVRNEVRRISRQVLGTSAVEVFIDEPRMVMAAYIRSMQKQYRNAQFMKRLQDDGLAKLIDRKKLVKQLRLHRQGNRAISRAKTNAAKAAVKIRGLEAEKARAKGDLAKLSSVPAVGLVDQADTNRAVAELLDSEIDESYEVADSILGDIEAAEAPDEVVDRTDLDAAVAGRERAEAGVADTQARLGDIDEEMDALGSVVDETEEVYDEVPADTGALQSTVDAEQAKLAELEAQRAELQAAPEPVVVDEPLPELTGLQAELDDTTEAFKDAQSRAKKYQDRVAGMEKVRRVASGESDNVGLLAKGQVRGTAQKEAADTADEIAATPLSRDAWDSLEQSEQIAAAREALDGAAPYGGRDEFKKELAKLEKEAAADAAPGPIAASDEYLAGLERELAEQKALPRMQRDPDEIKLLEEMLSDARKGVAARKKIDTKGYNEVKETEQILDRLFENYEVAFANAAKKGSASADPLTDALAELRKGNEFGAAQLKELESRIAAERKLAEDAVKIRDEIKAERAKLQAQIKKSAVGPADAAMKTKTAAPLKANEKPLAALEVAILEQENIIAAAQRAVDEAGTDFVVRREATKAARDARDRMGRLKASKTKAEKKLKAEQEMLDSARKVEADEYERFSALEMTQRTTVAEQQAALDELRIDLANNEAKRDSLIAERENLLEEADELLARAQAHMDEQRTALAEVERLQAAELTQRAKFTKAQWDQFEAEITLVPNLTESQTTDLIRTANSNKNKRQVRKWNLQVHDVAAGTLQRFVKERNLWADPDIVGAFEAINRLSSPKEVNAMVRAYDRVMTQWKGYALLSPGYHSRNFQTAIYMNALAGMSQRRYTQFGMNWAKINHAQKKGRDVGAVIDSIRDPKLREAMRTIHANRFIIFGDRGIQNLEDIASKAGAPKGVMGERLRKADPTSMAFKPLEINSKAAAFTERLARGPLALDSLLAGEPWEAAMDRVVKHHFDYTDLSYFEKNVMKRIVPFYTWTRKNLPVMLEYAAKKPGGMMWYLHAKRNLEAGIPEEEFVPGYFTSEGGIRSPFTYKGNRMYLAPDLPFLNLQNTAETGNLLGQVSPVFKTPFEMMAGKKVFNDVPLRDDLQEAPEAWGWLMPILYQAQAAPGMPEIIKQDGKYILSDKSAYLIEQANPLLGRARRLAPSGENRGDDKTGPYEDRRFSSILSTVFGFGAFTNTERTRQGEQLAREYALKDAAKKSKQIEQIVNRND